MENCNSLQEIAKHKMATFQNKYIQTATVKFKDQLPTNMLPERTYPTHCILPAKELRQESQDHEQPVKQYSKCGIVKNEWCCMLTTASSQCYAKTSNDCSILLSKKQINQQKLLEKYSRNDCESIMVSDATLRVAIPTATATVTTTLPTRINFIASKLADQSFPITSGAASPITQRPALKINYRKIKCKTNKHYGMLALFKTFSLNLLQIILTILTAASFSKTLSSHHTSQRASKAPKQNIRCQRMTTKGSIRTKFRILPSLGATSFLTLLTFVCFETVLLSTVSNCAKTFYMHWNTSNSIFRIDNTDHIIDVNKGNLAFEFDQVHIICPVYEPGTFENETEKYIIYNVSKVEYETCRITNADPRVIAICDKPQKLMFFTITFRPFTPQPGGLEFLPGNDYYFISTSSKDDLYRRIGGRCSTNNMKVVFKVCCAPEEKNKTSSTSISSSSGSSGSSGGDGNASTDNGDIGLHIDVNSGTNVNQHHMNNINTIGLMPNGGVGLMNTGSNNGIQLKPINGPTGTSINTNIDQFNRIPIQTNGINIMGNNNMGGVGHGNPGIMLSPGHHGGINLIPTVGGGGPLQYPGHHPGQTGIRINNVPPHYPMHKNQHNNNNNNNNNNNDDHYDKHQNEVVKNEELTLNSGGSSIHQNCIIKLLILKLNSIATYFELNYDAIVTAIGGRSSCSRTKFGIDKSIKHFFKQQLDSNIAERIVNMLDFRQFITISKVYDISLNYKSIILLLLIYIVTLIHFGFDFISNILKVFTKKLTIFLSKKITTTSYLNNIENIPLEYLDENLQALR